MGAEDRVIFRTVILPLITPYIVSGYAFAFVLSLNEYIVAYMTVGFTMETLPIKIFTFAALWLHADNGIGHFAVRTDCSGYLWSCCAFR